MVKCSRSRQQESFGRKRAEQWWPRAVEGHSYFSQTRGIRANAVGQNLAARGSAWFAGQRPSARMVRRQVRQRSLPGDLIFGSFYQEKEQSLPAAIERANVSKLTISPLFIGNNESFRHIRIKAREFTTSILLIDQRGRPLGREGPDTFVLTKVSKKSRQKKALARKPYTRPAFLSAPRAFYFAFGTIIISGITFLGFLMIALISSKSTKKASAHC